jgi:hypothetical protein
MCVLSLNFAIMNESFMFGDWFFFSSCKRILLYDRFFACNQNVEIYLVGVFYDLFKAFEFLRQRRGLIQVCVSNKFTRHKMSAAFAQNTRSNDSIVSAWVRNAALFHVFSLFFISFYQQTFLSPRPDTAGESFNVNNKPIKNNFTPAAINRKILRL